MLYVEIADKPYAQQQGLMFRKSMPDEEGMMFVFDRTDNLRFWGANTYIPLDIAFVNKNGEISEIKNIKPLSDKPVISQEKCNIAIEANMGFFEKNKIYEGQKINLENIGNKSGLVTFAQAEDPMTEEELRTINIEDLDSILEDSFDETEELGDIELEKPPLEEQQPQVPLDETVTDEDYPVFETNQEALNWATGNNEIVRIWYRTKGGRDIKRDIEPHGQFMAHTTGNNIVVSFDKTIGEIRAFIVNNILHYSFLGEDFKRKFNINF